MARISLICSLLIFATHCGYGQWERLDFPGVYAYTLSQTTHGLLAATSRTIYRSTNNGASWDSLSSIEQIGISNILQVGDILLLTTSRLIIWPSYVPSIFRSLDFGQTWYPMLDAIYGAESIVFINNTLYIDRDGNIFFSPDTGATWTRLDADTTFPDAVSGLAGHAGSLYAIIQGNALYRSDNFGLTWDSLSTAFSRSFYNVVPQNSMVYVGTVGEGFYLSTDKGQDWSSSNYGLPDSVGFWALHMYQDYLIASISQNFQQSIYSYDLKTHIWRDFNQGLSIRKTGAVWDIASNDQYVFLAVDSTVWRRSLSDLVTGVPQLEGLPIQVFLYPNSPNPFNSSTTLSFAVNESRFATLKVFDQLGRDITTLFAGFVIPGTYSFRWDAGNLASGIYFARLASGSTLITQKMILSK